MSAATAVGSSAIGTWPQPGEGFDAGAGRELIDVAGSARQQQDVARAERDGDRRLDQGRRVDAAVARGAQDGVEARAAAQLLDRRAGVLGRQAGRVAVRLTQAERASQPGSERRETARHPRGGQRP
jgi:hypothetical protein